MSSEAPREYEHLEFAFTRPSMCLDGKSYEVSAYLLVPVELMPELKAWTEAEARGDKTNPFGSKMLAELRKKGALLHREDGPALREVEKSMFDKKSSKVTKEEYWEKGVQKEGFAPRVKPLGKYTL